MERNLHVVMLPWSAFGHIIPFYQLSIGLAKSGVKVSFVSTPRNIQRLPKPPSKLSNLLNLVDLPLPKLDDELLPEDAEATVDIPFEKIQYLKVAYDLLQQPFKQFIADQLPDWIIIDFLPWWSAEIAQEYRVNIMNFSVFCASSYSFFANPPSLVGEGQKRLRPSPESMTLPPEWIPFPSAVAYRIHEAIPTHAGFYGDNASGISDAQRIAKCFQSIQALAIRSCPEFEGEYLKLMSELIGKSVIPVGLLLPEKQERNGTIMDESWKKIFEWLDKQKPKTVVFVGFGSECKLSKDQVFEIAHGLELSGLPFLWALRKPNWANDDLDALPLDYADRTSERGMVCMGWAPQMEILGHPSIGGSLFHSGWGSVIETLQFGHCLVVLPFIIDQPLNARVLAEKGLAVEIEKREDGSINRHDIAEALRLAMVSEEGERYRVRAREVAKIFGDKKLHEYYLGKFVEYLADEAHKH